MNDDNRVTIQETFSIPCYSLYKQDKVDKKFTLRAMTTMEEKLRLSSNSFDTIAKIIKRCLETNKDLDINQLKLVDIQYLMYKLRIVTYGADYNIYGVRCPHCGKIVDVVYNLDDLEVNELPEDFKEPFEIGKLPISGDVLQCKLLTTQDYLDIIDEANEKKEKFPDYEGDPMWEFELMREICTVNKEVYPLFKMQQYIENLHARDYQYFIKKYDDMVGSIGINKNVEFDCPECNKKFRYMLPLTEEFFRPTYRD